MANHPSAIKRARQNVSRSKRNQTYRTLLKTTTKKVLAAVEAKDKDKAKELLTEATRAISKIKSKGVIHKRTASRKISGLSRRVNQISKVS